MIGLFNRGFRRIRTPFGPVKIIAGPSKSDCFDSAELSPDAIIKFDISPYIKTPPDDIKTPEIAEIYKKVKLVYAGASVDIKKLSQGILQQLQKTNSYPSIVPLLQKMPGFSTTKKIILAPFLLCLNVLARSSEYAFMPYREPVISKEKLKKVFYTMDKRFITWEKNYGQISAGV